LNLDLSATISGPTNGRLDCASGWEALVFPSWKVFVWMPDFSAVPPGEPVSDMRVFFL
jgi:hypothetical protein